MLILYNPPSSAGRKPVLPMSLLAVGALLEGHHEYRIIDGNLVADSLAELTSVIRATDADVLAVTVMPGPQLSHAVPLCRELKARFPQLTIVWGGYFPTQHYDVCLRADFVDFVVRGHGEVVFRELMDRLRSGEDPTSLAGLAFRDATSGEPRTGRMAAIPHPDELPDFPYDAIDAGRYVRRTFMGARTLPHHSSYGCPFKCNFCAVVNMVDGRWLTQSAERTANVTHTLVARYAVDAVEFYDNNFFVREARTVEFADRIAKLGIGWWGEARVDTLCRYSDESWERMRRSGLRMVFLGAESGSDATLQRMNKGGTASAAKTLELVRRMADYNIVPELSFVLGNPPDAEADAAETMEFIRRIKRVNPAAEIILYMYTPVPLSGELFDAAKAGGFAYPETLDGWVDPSWLEFSQRRSSRMPWVQDPLRQRIRNFERVLNAYHPTTTDIRLTGPRRALLRSLSAWRYHLRVYRSPLELAAVQRVLSYERPETSGF